MLRYAGYIETLEIVYCCILLQQLLRGSLTSLDSTVDPHLSVPLWAEGCLDYCKVQITETMNNL